MLARLKTVVSRRSATRPRRKPQLPPARVRALEALWGTGRYGPGDGALDDMILDCLGFKPCASGPIGMIGADPVLAAAAASRFGAQITLAEWRGPCAERSADLEQGLTVTGCALDRACPFDNESLDGVVSVNAAVFATHKTTVMANVFRSLRAGGVWVLADLARGDETGATIDDEVFASAWSDGQPAVPDELARMLGDVGFDLIRRDDISEQVASAARHCFARFERHIDAVVQPGLPDHELMLREISWETTSWRARLAALREQALCAILWVAVKKASDDAPAEPQAQEAPPE